ncbi:sigma 54-interacting transcriptional regulator, partial [Rhizobium sp.]|uniref:sigma 54-interacting transcriptional regulator n=1 Tax=Rhizobium sp. TaxID=391 RepID=UPI002F0FA6F9
LLDDAPSYSRQNAGGIFVVIKGPDRGEQVRLTREPVSFGSGPQCSLVLTDKTVSRKHVEAQLVGDEVLMIDCGSTNGTFIQGSRFEKIAIGFGAEVKLGRTVIKFLPDEEIVEPEPSAQSKLGSMVGGDTKMRQMFTLLEDVAATAATVLIEGETGTGKELVAQLLHRWSARRARRFLAVDCAALPDAIADEALFGNRLQRGRIADADRGTLFLDEIDSMSSALQGKLLRVVEERELPSVSGEPRAVDLRIIAAAKDHLAGAVANGRFRSDLLYRLETVRLRIPPLRERRADVGLLFAYFIGEAAKQFGRPRPVINAAIEARLISDNWTGNVRELRNFATQTVLGLGLANDSDGDRLSLSEQMDRFEIGIIQAALNRAQGDVGQAAEALKLPRRSLYARLQRHGIDGAAFRSRG